MYVPKRTESPLYIRPGSDASEAVTDNFLVPQWGGVIVYNSDKLSKSSVVARDSGDRSGAPLSVEVKMDRLMPVFVRQLQMLLGVPEIVSGDVVRQSKPIPDF